MPQLDPDIQQALAKVPDYQRFLSVDEMFGRAREVAARHPDLARLTVVGHSTDGDEIPMVSIGDGPLSVLLYACPHPNEPIGAMLVQFLLDELIENEDLRAGRTWHLLTCVDPDGTRLNEAWFAGPFSVRNYARNFYRPRSAEQVEWTFPIDYKNYSFQSPMPETRALMAALDAERPDVIYSLHNAGFGGVYYYISRDLKGAYQQFHALPESRDLFLSLGEPEMPWAVEFAPAVYAQPSVRDAYDYEEEFGNEPPETKIQGGGSAYDYIRSIGLGDSVLFVTEMPYFQAERIADLSEIDRSRRDVLLQGTDQAEEATTTLKAIFDEIEPRMTKDTRFLRAVRSFIEYYMKSFDSKRNWAMKADGMDQKATVAQEIDELYVGAFYRLLVSSMLRRAIDAQLAEGDDAALRAARERLEGHLEAWTQVIEDNLEYTPIPIKKLVEVQYGALLAVLKAV